MTTYSFEDRAKARSAVRRLRDLSTAARLAYKRNEELDPTVLKSICDLTRTEDKTKHVDLLTSLADRVQESHLEKLFPLAREEFNAFCECITPDEPPAGKWLEWLTGILQKIETEPGYERFVLNVPPGHAKSTYASRLFVAWRIGRHPKDKVIGGGHSQRFVENEFSKKIRSIVISPTYRRIFPDIIVDHTTRAKDQWELVTGGSYVAKGAGQAIHGFRANFACIDDPYAKISDAESPAIREDIKTWFFNDIGSRLLPGAQVFLIMTRFHEEDLTGACIKMNEELAEKDRYKIISVPAICDDEENDILDRELGEVLWPYYNVDYFAKKRVEWSFQRFALTYQQMTEATADGTVASKFQYYQRLPHQTDEALNEARRDGKVDPGTLRPITNIRDHFRTLVLSVDTASTTNERSDYSVGQVWGITGDRKYYLIDQFREKVEFNSLIEKIETMASKWGVDKILVEDKGHGHAYIQNRGSTDNQRRLAPAPLEAIKVNAGDGKTFRFDEVSPLIEAGEVYLPAQANFTSTFLREVGQFPDGAHDDCVDAMTQFLKWAKGNRTRFGTRKIKGHG